jgi:hypothetical protein
LKLLILDANVVIRLCELGLWQAVLAGCDVHLSRIVVDDEVKYYHGKEQDKLIDLSRDVANGQIRVFDVAAGTINDFRKRFDPTYFERLDPGEAESLAFMLGSREEYLISSADSIVYKTIGNLNMAEQGISLEEVLQKIGQGRSDLTWQYTKEFRLKYTDEGKRDSVIGRGDQQKGQPRRPG